MQSLIRTGAIALRDAVVLARIEGRGRWDAPLIGCRFKAALSVDKEKRDHPSTLRVNPRERLSPAGSRRSFTSWIPKAVGGKVGLFIARSPAPCLPVSSIRDPALVLALARMDDSIPEDQTARSHRPSAVEHRDCPPCGGDMGNISPGGTRWGWAGLYPPAAFALGR